MTKLYIKRSFKIPLKQTDLNQIDYSIESSPDDNHKKEDCKYSPPGSTNDESYSSTDCSSELCQLSGTKYCLESTENKEKLTTRVYVCNLQKNNIDQIAKMFRGKPIDIPKIIESIKCTICHDILDEDCNKCSVCKATFCSMCQTKLDIKYNISCPNVCDSCEIVKANSEVELLISCIKIKCENHSNGCDFSNKSLQMIHNHEAECQYKLKICTYCKKNNILEKDWGEHIFNKCKAITKCSHWPDCNFIGLKQQVDQHEEEDCDYLTTTCDTVLYHN